MLAAARVLRWAAVTLWDETFLLLRANVVWFLLSLPLAVPVLLPLAIRIPLGNGEPNSGGPLLPLIMTGFLLLLIPNPASLGMYRVTAVLRNKESPPWREFWTATRQNLGLGLKLYAIGVVGVILLTGNVLFYWSQSFPLKILVGLWVCLLYVWLALQFYLGSLVMYLGERRLVSLYRRAALLALGHPFYVLTFVLMTALLTLLNALGVPLLPLVQMAFVALLSTGALAELKRRYDPQPDPDSEEERV